MPAAGRDSTHGEAGTAARTGAQAVDRALALLTLFVGADESGLTLTEAAAAVDLRPSTAHRLLRALVRAGYLDQDRSSERYRLGTMAAVLGRAAGPALGLDLGQSVVEELAASTGETTSVGVRDGAQVLVVLAADSDQPLRVDRGVGIRVAAHSSAIGKAILAFTDDDVDAVVSGLGPLERFTAATLSTPAALGAELRSIRRTGVAVNREERYAGVAAVAAPVLDRRSVARAGVGVQLPSSRLDDRRCDQLAALVVDAAERLSAALDLERL